MGVDVEAVARGVTEAVTNAVVRGYRAGRFGLVRIHMRASADVLTISVSDSGEGMAPNPGARGPGLGLSLIGRVCDESEVQSPQPGGTRVVMSFRAAQAPRSE